jgi:thiamine biosynthesis lipoprotein
MRVPILALAMLFLAACARAPQPERFQGPTMGTTYSVVVASAPKDVTRDSLQSVIDAVLAESNRHLSTYDPAAELARFNAAAGSDWLPVSQPLFAVLSIAQEVSAATGGAFDVTVGPLVQRWGFGGGDDTAAAPDAAEIAALRELVGYTRLELEPQGPSIRKSVASLQVDVGAVAPGWAVDEIARRFEALGVERYLVEIGGEVRGRGQSPAGRPWRVAIEAPLAGQRRPYALVDLDGMGVSTSGDYRDFRILDGRRISHTIDPRTGAPVQHTLASACVVHPSTARADAYATALMVLGPEEGMVLARRLGLAVLLIERVGPDGDLREHSTPQFERLRRPLG